MSKDVPRFDSIKWFPDNIWFTGLYFNVSIYVWCILNITSVLVSNPQGYLYYEYVNDISEGKQRFKTKQKKT